MDVARAGLAVMQPVNRKRLPESPRLTNTKFAKARGDFMPGSMWMEAEGLFCGSDTRFRVGYLGSDLLGGAFHKAADSLT